MKDQESKTEYVDCYADRYRMYLVFFLTPVYLGMEALLLYAFAEFEDVWAKLFFAVLALSFLIIAAKEVLAEFRAYPVKSRIDKDGIECTLFGRYVKGLTWDKVKDIVCVEFKHFGAGHSPANYLLFSGHELNAEEKDKCIKLAGYKNDIIVVKYSYKLVDRINEIHEFTFKDEITRDGHKKHPLSR